MGENRWFEVQHRVARIRRRAVHLPSWLRRFGVGSRVYVSGESVPRLVNGTSFYVFVPQWVLGILFRLGLYGSKT